MAIASLSLAEYVKQSYSKAIACGRKGGHEKRQATQKLPALSFGKTIL
jgi:hypothetical protein